MDMNPEIRAAWVAALRSGKYPQTGGYLNVPGNGFCCLGVLCELAVKAGVIARQDGEGDDGLPVIEYGGAYGGYEEWSTVVVPQPVAAWAGMDVHSGDPQVDSEVVPDSVADLSDTVVSMTELNDTYKASFAQIADVIEADGRWHS